VSRVPLRFIPPQLASSVDQPPEGKHWIHEIKYDGYRCQVLREGRQARVLTRNGHDWSDRYSYIAALRTAMRWRPERIILYAFDLMHLNGRDLRQQALSERREILKALVGRDDESRIQFSDEFHGDGTAFFRACADKGLEGIVSKQAYSHYQSGRSKTWLKTKCFTESTFVVVGTDHDRKTGALRALLSHPDSDGLRYAGAAFIALSDDKRAEFLAEVERLTTAWAAFKSSRLSDAKWCQPKLTVRVKHLAGSKTLRHATVRGMAE
jgi:bifunctional non-homologous end joining protein LigD